MHPFSTPWKHQGNTCFQGIEKGCIGNEWVKDGKWWVKALVDKSVDSRRNKRIIHIYLQWRIQRFFGNTVFSRGFLGRNLKGHKGYKWHGMAWYGWHGCGVTYYEKCDYYVLINCIRHCIRRDFIWSLLIWDKNLGSNTGSPVAKTLHIRPWSATSISA